MKLVFVILVVVFCILSAGCSSYTGAKNNGSPPQKLSSDHGFVLNESVRPGDDFFAYANDAWMQEHPVPADKSSYTTFVLLRDKADDNIHSLLEDAANTTSEGADQNITRIGQFYRSGMDTERIDQQGIQPLSDDLAMISAINSRPALTNATIHLLEQGFGPVYTLSGEVNPRDTREMIPGLKQGGLGLPDRDYYLRTDNKSREIQDAYRAHITRVFQLMGEEDAQAVADANTVYRMELALAGAHFSTEENRDPEKVTNIYPVSTLVEQYPAIGWESISAIPGSGTIEKFDIHQPGFVQELNSQLETAPLEDWKVFLRYHLVNDASPYLGKQFEEENFGFYETTINGVKEMKPRWKRVVATENAALGDLVGRAYVTRYVDPRTREMVIAMFASIRQTLSSRISNLTWMSNSTKAAAHEKLDAMGEKIAYPDRWTDYSGLNLTDSYIGNVRAVNAYNFIHGPYGLEKIGKPVDRSTWDVPPQTVNAFYDPTKNEMVFPAGILQPPFFNPDADPALNYGALGWAIGHEMTHGFDDEGRQYDRNGNLNNWWTDADSREYANRTSLLVQEYNRFEILPGLYNNGNLTLGENIADFGGLTLAYHAWKSTEPAGTGVIATNRSQDRTFFIGAAQLWKATYREDMLRNRVYTDPHTANRYRVNGVLFNIPEFYLAFPEIQPGDALYRNVSERPVIW